MSTVPAASAAPVVATADAPTGRWSRWSDRLNPILVREVQQAVKGRVFALTVTVALAVTVAIAAWIVGHYEPGGGSGRDAFRAGLATLMPLLLFVVPMQAFQSMRLELRAGIVEQLLLSRLRPLRILLGKLQAAMVQFVIYVAVMSPLLATSYLLRGVDVPTIVVSLVFAALSCMVGTMFAVSSAAQGVLPGLQGIANLATAFGLGMLSFGAVGFIASGEYTQVLGWLLRSSQFWAVLTAIVLLAFASSILALLAARSFLLHAFENKATAFRVFLYTLPPVAFGWMLLFVDPANRRQAVPYLTFAMLLVGVAFGVFMVTEQRELSPRLRAHAPRHAAFGVLASPFLPGRDRGIACFLGYALLLAAIAWFGWPPRPFGDDEVDKVAAMTLAYALVYFGLGRWLRSRLPPNVQGNHAARFLLPVLLFLFSLLPILIDAFARGGADSWHLGHVMNPFFTIHHFARNTRWPQVQVAMLAVLFGAAVLQLPACVRGLREVLAAGAARRAAKNGDG